MMIDDRERDAVLSGHRPPHHAIECAIQASRLSPCAKSQRGVALFNRAMVDEAISNGVDPGSWTIVGAGFNGPPRGFICQINDRCRESCAKVCLHAEDRAIRAAGALDDVPDLELVHVHTVDGSLVAGGGPSCWQCSRIVADVGLRGVWLYQVDEGPRGESRDRWRYYTAVEFHLETLKHCELPYQYPHCMKYLGDNDATTPQLTCIRPRGHSGDCDNLRP